MSKTKPDYFTYEKQTNIKKMLAFFIDYILIAVLGLVFSITVATPILKTTNVYKNSVDEMEVTSKECYQIQCEAKLSIKKDENSILNEDELFLEYVNAHILLSYSYHTEQYNNDGITFSDTSNKATFDNDYIAYYYSQYKNEKNIKVSDYNDKTGKEYFISLINGGDANTYFEYHENDLPSLKVEVGKDLYNYVNKINKSSTYFSSFKSAFLDLNRKALIELNEYEPYQIQYDKYIAAYENICKAQNSALVIVFSSLFVVLLLLPKVISGNGVTIGNLLTKTRARYNKNKWLSLLIDNVLTYIIMFSSIGFIGLFSFGIATLSIKLFGSITLLTFVLVSSIVLIADFILTSFVPKNFTLIEISSFETFVDVHKNVTEEEINNENNEA